jgi:glycosyltransferase involved in cell wall biosynthesis
MNEKISVIVPIHNFPKEFETARNHIHLAKTPIEIIYVINEKIKESINDLSLNEIILRIHDRGRGYMMLEGVKNATGDIILLLHADTILPNKWDILIHSAMKNNAIIGGGFSLTFDRNPPFLFLMVLYVKISSKITKVISGDRAIFVRRKPLQKHLYILKTPIMEDIALSKWMKKQGKIKFLKQSIITSADAFVTNGFFKQTYKIIKCVLWYKLTKDTQKIYHYYYNK